MQISRHLEQIYVVSLFPLYYCHGQLASLCVYIQCILHVTGRSIPVVVYLLLPVGSDGRATRAIMNCKQSTEHSIYRSTSKRIMVVVCGQGPDLKLE